MLVAALHCKFIAQICVAFWLTFTFVILGPQRPHEHQRSFVIPISCRPPAGPGHLGPQRPSGPPGYLKPCQTCRDFLDLMNLSYLHELPDLLDYRDLLDPSEILSIQELPDPDLSTVLDIQELSDLLEPSPSRPPEISVTPVLLRLLEIGLVHIKLSRLV